MGGLDREVHDPLSRAMFEAIVYNAVGRGSEVNTYPAFALSHSTGNSGWSTGIVQWDFGQPGRGHKVLELLEQYQAWAPAEARFGTEQAASLSQRLQRRGQAGNALEADERERLNAYLRSGEGREFVEGLNREQVDYKWQRVGEPLARIRWLSDLGAQDPAGTVEIVAMAAKLFNQNEVRGARLLAHLQRNELSPDGVSEWIGSTGIDGLTANARRAILSGRDQVRVGAGLLNALQYGNSPVSERWRAVVERGDASLSRGFEFNPDLQLFDAMLRHPRQGLPVLRAIGGAMIEQPLSIRGINALARWEMARIRIDPAEGIFLTSVRGTEYSLQDATWMLARPVPGRRAVDEPDHTEGMRQRPAVPAGASLPGSDALQRLLRALYEKHGIPGDGPALEQVAGMLFAEARGSGSGAITHVALAVQDPHQGLAGSRVIAWLGNPGDPATPWVSLPMKHEQASVQSIRHGVSPLQHMAHDPQLAQQPIRQSHGPSA